MTSLTLNTRDLKTLVLPAVLVGSLSHFSSALKNPPFSVGGIYYFTLKEKKNPKQTWRKENFIFSYQQIYKPERAVSGEWWEQKPTFQGLKCEWIKRERDCDVFTDVSLEHCLYLMNLAQEEV